MTQSMKEEEEKWTGEEHSRDDIDITTRNSHFKIQSCWLLYWGLWSPFTSMAKTSEKCEVMKRYLQIRVS